MMNILKRLFKPKDYRTYVTEKVADIHEQIQYLESDPSLIKAATIGSKDQMSPKDLIGFQQNRIKTLYKIGKNNKMENIELLNSYYNTMCKNCQNLFLKYRTSAVPCEVDFFDYSYCDLIKQAIENGY